LEWLTGWNFSIQLFFININAITLNAIDAREPLTKSAGEGQPMKRTARMFDDRATPRSPFVVAYSPRSHPDTPTDSSLSSTLRPQFAILIGNPIYQKSRLNITT